LLSAGTTNHGAFFDAVARKRLEYALAGQSIVLPPADEAMHNFGVEVPLAPLQQRQVQSTKYVRLKMSEVLARFLTTQRAQGIDGRVESEVAPIVHFVINLLNDPVMLDINGDHLLTITREVAEIPLPKGFGQDERSLYFRWSTARENGWVRERDGKNVQLKRVSQTTLDGKYAPGLTAFWKFAIEHWFAHGPVPSFEFGTKLNRPAAERDAFNEEEVLTFFGAPPLHRLQEHGIASNAIKAAACTPLFLEGFVSSATVATREDDSDRPRIAFGSLQDALLLGHDACRFSKSCKALCARRPQSPQRCLFGAKLAIKDKAKVKLLTALKNSMAGPAVSGSGDCGGSKRARQRSMLPDRLKIPKLKAPQVQQIQTFANRELS